MIDPISWGYSWPYLFSAFIGGYLIGSIPFGLLLTKFVGLGDIRKIGSGNIGATNVLRTGNKRIAATTLILDSSKGSLAVVLGQQLGSNIAIVSGLSVLLGHMFPIWLRFRGGKGVATALGIFLGLTPMVGVFVCLIWLSTALLFRYSSLAALCALAGCPILLWHFGHLQTMELSIVIAVLIFAKHWKNILRLAQGLEPKIQLNNIRKS